MPHVVGIRFKDSGKVYFFNPNSLELLVPGEHVIVETVRGLELAKVADEPRTVDQSEVVGELKPVVRRADSSDFARLDALNERHDEILARCNEKVVEHNLGMRLVKAEYSFDGSRLTFYFTAEKRVDFRALVRDLARAFRARIELRQIGPRDEAKLLGGIGPCGRLLCCATFLPDYARVSIKMAKDQDLPLNPVKISGVCGRLLCCLSYEHEQYLEIKSELPRRGAWVQTPEGPGEVIMVNVVRETVTVELASSGSHEEFKPELLQEAIRRVGELARSRNEEGITPVAPTMHERPTPRPPREQRNRGERRFLRDELEPHEAELNDALSLLDESGADGQPQRSEPARPPRNEAARPQRPDANRPRRGPPPAARANAAPVDHAPANPARKPGPPRPRTRDGNRDARPNREAAPNTRPQAPTLPRPAAPPGGEPRPAPDAARRPRRRRRSGGGGGGGEEA